MALAKSKAELAAEATVRAVQRGRATTGEAALMLGVCWKTVDTRVKRGRLATILVGRRRFITLPSLQRAGVVLPPLHTLHAAIDDSAQKSLELLGQYTSHIDSNEDDPGAYYD